jgi:zinc protease
MRRFPPFMLALALALSAAARLTAQPLPSDPRLDTGVLDNGLHYIILRHDNPPGRAAAWLHVSSGSLNETDEQRGIAHYLEHMAFNGSKNFAPGTVINFFQSMGMSFGRDQNAFTSFDQTTFQLSLPDNQPETLGKGLLFLSDVAMRLNLSPEEIQSERGVILEERRTRLGGPQRVQDQIFQRLAPGSIFGERIPIGTEATINSVQQPDFQAYYGKWYVPSNMTVMVVADTDPAGVVDQIKANFGEGRRAVKPVDQDPRVSAYDSTRAIVVSDKELADARLSITRIERPRPPTTTVPQYRADLVELMGKWIFNRRLQAKVDAGKASFLNAGASASDVAEAIRWINVSAFGETDKWPQMLADLATELQRARLHGFTPREVQDARTELLARAQRAVKTEPTRDARQILDELNSAVSSGEPVMSAQEDLDLQQQLLPTITPDEVSQTFSELFNPVSVAFILQLPTSADVPTEDRLVELGRKALDVAPESEAERARPAALLTQTPKPGELLEFTEHQPTSVWSGWLSNNARVNYRFMDYKKDQVTVTITLAGGEIQETPENRGITQAGAMAWEHTATSTLSSTDIRDLMTGKKVGVTGRPGTDAMFIRISGSPDELEVGLQEAYLMLTDPVIEPAALENWKAEELQAIARRGLSVEGVFADALMDTILPPGEVRQKPLTKEQVERQTAPQAQAWLRQVIAAAPIEVSVVGDIDKDRAMELVKTYIGSLPSRDRISAQALASLRQLHRPVGPLVGDRAIDTKTTKALVLSGFFGADAKDLRDVRLLELAARVISTRMIKDIREDKQLVYSIQAGSQPGVEFPGYGLFSAFSFTAPEKVASLIAAIEDEYKAFAESGPTADELDTARKQIATRLDEQMKEPGFWTGRIQQLTYRDAHLDDIVAAPAAYQAFTADEIKDAFGRYYKPQTSFVISSHPASAPAAEAPESKEKTASE